MTLNDLMEQACPFFGDRGLAGTDTLLSLNNRLRLLFPLQSAPVIGLLAEVGQELRREGIPSPYTQPLTYACIWADVARLGGVELPANVAALIAGDTVELVPH